mgnify:CR=1 FL=1
MRSKEELEKQLENTVESLKEDAQCMDDREVAFEVGYISALCYVLQRKYIAEEMQDEYMP